MASVGESNPSPSTPAPSFDAAPLVEPAGTGDAPPSAGPAATTPPAQWNPAGRVVIVTGASSGIGEAIARELYNEGARIVLVARRASRLRILSMELGGALAIPADITDPIAVARIVSQTLVRYGRIDALVNNAGVSLGSRMDELSLDEFTRVVALNVTSMIALTQAVLPAMRAQGDGGRIVNISSGTTRMALPGVGGYAATKAAVNMLSAVSRAELAPENIVVSVVLPSITATEFGTDPADPETIFTALRPGQVPRPGMVAHSAEYVAKVVMRALHTGEASIDIPHGVEQPEVTEVPAAPEAPEAPGAATPAVGGGGASGATDEAANAADGAGPGSESPARSDMAGQYVSLPPMESAAAPAEPPMSTRDEAFAEGVETIPDFMSDADSAQDPAEAVGEEDDTEAPAVAPAMATPDADPQERVADSAMGGVTATGEDTGDNSVGNNHNGDANNDGDSDAVTGGPQDAEPDADSSPSTWSSRRKERRATKLAARSAASPPPEEADGGDDRDDRAGTPEPRADQ